MSKLLTRRRRGFAKDISFKEIYDGVIALTTRSYRIARIVRERASILSIYLVSNDERKLDSFAAGQFLTLEIPEVGERSYLLSMYSRLPASYRITVRVESGRQSSAFWQKIAEPGVCLVGSEPAGHFTLPSPITRPLVIIGADLAEAALAAIAEELSLSRTTEVVQFLYGTRNGSTFALREKMVSLQSQMASSQWRIWYSHPRADDRLGRDYHAVGHVDDDGLEQLLPRGKCDIFLCGPDAFVASVSDRLGSPKRLGRRLHKLALGAVVDLPDDEGDGPGAPPLTVARRLRSPVGVNYDGR